MFGVTVNVAPVVVLNVGVPDKPESAVSRSIFHFSELAAVVGTIPFAVTVRLALLPLNVTTVSLGDVPVAKVVEMLVVLKVPAAGATLVTGFLVDGIDAVKELTEGADGCGFLTRIGARLQNVMGEASHKPPPKLK